MEGAVQREDRFHLADRQESVISTLLMRNHQNSGRLVCSCRREQRETKLLSKMHEIISLQQRTAKTKQG